MVSVLLWLHFPEVLGTILLELISWFSGWGKKRFSLPSFNISLLFNMEESFKLLRVVEEIIWVMGLFEIWFLSKKVLKFSIYKSFWIFLGWLIVFLYYWIEFCIFLKNFREKGKTNFYFIIAFLMEVVLLFWKEKKLLKKYFFFNLKINKL